MLPLSFQCGQRYFIGDLGASCRRTHEACRTTGWILFVIFGLPLPLLLSIIAAPYGTVFLQPVCVPFGIISISLAFTFTIGNDPLGRTLPYQRTIRGVILRILNTAALLTEVIHAIGKAAVFIELVERFRHLAVTALLHLFSIGDAK